MKKIYIYICDIKRILNRYAYVKETHQINNEFSSP